MPEQPRILVLRGGAIGDFILTLPFLRALRDRWPDAYIELTGYPHIANLALAGGLVDHVDSLDRADMATFFSLRPEFQARHIERLRSFHIVFSFLHDPHAIVKTNLERAGARLVLYGDPIVQGRHAVDQLLKPLESLAIYPDEADRRPRLQLRADLPQRGQAWLAARGLDGRRIAMLHPGSGSPRKNWPLPRFLKLAERLRAGGFEIVFVAGEADAALVPRLGDAPRLTGLTLVDTACVLAHATLFVGNDSGITHLAAALGRPTVAIFGPSDPALWAPRGEHVRVQQAPHGQLNRLALQSVWNAVAQIPDIRA